MGGFPGVQHAHAIRAFERAGFWIKRQSKHIVMTDGKHTITIPRNNPIHQYTMAAIIAGSGLTQEEFRKWL